MLPGGIKQLRRKWISQIIEQSEHRGLNLWNRGLENSQGLHLGLAFVTL